MKKIYLQVPSINLANNAMFIENDVNNALEPWKELKRQLSDMGFDLLTADDNSLDDCHHIIFFDSGSVDGVKHQQDLLTTLKQIGRKTPATWPIRPLYDEAIKKGLRDKMTLIIWEPQSVRPANYDKNVWDKFQRILTWDDDLVDNKKFFKFRLPIPAEIPPFTPTPFSERKLLINITANKYSSKRNELYSMRRKSIEYFTVNYPNDFDLYGVRWNTAVTPIQRRLPWLVKKYKSYRGKTMSKIETLSRYKFTLCYENMTGIRGLVTEKIFDALKAGSVPIYLGADNISEYVDEDTFIDRRKFKSDADLAEFLLKITETEHAKYLSSAKKYMDGQKYKKFLPSAFCKSIIDGLNLYNVYQFTKDSKKPEKLP